MRHMRRQPRIMGGDQQGGALRIGGTDQQPGDPLRIGIVQRRCRLVRDQQVRPADQRPRHGRALRLPLAQRAGTGVSAMAKANLVQQAGDLHIISCPNGQLLRQPKVCRYGQCLDQSQCLEDDADPSATQIVPGGGRARHLLARHTDGAVLHRQQARDKVDQRRRRWR